MAARLWVTDREPGIRQLFEELLPEADVLAPDALNTYLAAGARPEAIVIDGTQLMELHARRRRAVLEVPRVLVCTGMLLASMPTKIVGKSNVAVLAKPFCVDDLEAAIEWLRGSAMPRGAAPSEIAATLSRPRQRRVRPPQPVA